MARLCFERCFFAFEQLRLARRVRFIKPERMRLYSEGLARAREMQGASAILIIG